ncbi:MAG: hypothetical protein R3C97_02825 [Geminicoccaceae bacterium]
MGCTVGQVSVIAVAVFLIIAIEYWRASKTTAGPTIERAEMVRGPISMSGEILSASGRSGTVAMRSANDGLPNASSADLVAAGQALDQANRRVRLLGEERDALLIEREELVQTRGVLSQRLDAATAEIAALEEKVADLDGRVMRGGGETEKMRLTLDGLEADLLSVREERDRLRDQLDAAGRRIAELESMPRRDVASNNGSTSASRQPSSDQQARIVTPPKSRQPARTADSVEPTAGQAVPTRQPAITCNARRPRSMTV